MLKATHSDSVKSSSRTLSRHKNTMPPHKDSHSSAKSTKHTTPKPNTLKRSRAEAESLEDEVVSVRSHRNRSMKGLSKEAKLNIRRKQNREAARRCRKRKKERLLLMNEFADDDDEPVSKPQFIPPQPPQPLPQPLIVFPVSSFPLHSTPLHFTQSVAKVVNTYEEEIAPQNDKSFCYPVKVEPIEDSIISHEAIKMELGEESSYTGLRFPGLRVNTSSSFDAVLDHVFESPNSYLSSSCPPTPFSPYSECPQTPSSLPMLCREICLGEDYYSDHREYLSHSILPYPEKCPDFVLSDKCPDSIHPFLYYSNQMIDTMSL